MEKYFLTELLLFVKAIGRSLTCRLKRKFTFNTVFENHEKCLISELFNTVDENYQKSHNFTELGTFSKKFIPKHVVAELFGEKSEKPDFFTFNFTN